MASAGGNNQNLTTKVLQASTTTKQQREKAFTDLITSQLAQQFQAMKSLVPKHVTPERMARIGLQAISRNPKLMDCTPESIIGAIMNCATLGLEPNLIGHAFLVPFWNNKTGKMECQFQIGYKGMLDLVRRSGDVSSVYAYEVCENDEFDYELGVNAKLKHKPLLRGDRGAVYAYYSVYHLKDGGFGFYVISKDDAMAHAQKFSKSKKDGVLYGTWIDHFDEMAKKTALKAMTKYMPTSIETPERRAELEALTRDDMVIKLEKDKTGLSGSDMMFVTQTVDMETGEIISNAETAELPAQQVDENYTKQVDTPQAQPTKEETELEKHRRLTKNL